MLLLLRAALQNIDKWRIYFTSFNSKFRFVVHKIVLEEATLSNANCFTDNFNFQYTEELSRDTDRQGPEGGRSYINVTETLTTFITDV